MRQVCIKSGFILITAQLLHYQNVTHLITTLLYDSEIWFLILINEHKLRVFQHQDSRQWDSILGRLARGTLATWWMTIRAPDAQGDIWRRVPPGTRHVFPVTGSWAQDPVADHTQWAISLKWRTEQVFIFTVRDDRDSNAHISLILEVLSNASRSAVLIVYLRSSLYIL